MPDAKYTPGPWMESLHDEWDFGGVIANAECIATTHTPCIGGDLQANTFLIAAAPELLEACERMLWAAGGHHDTAEACDFTRAAIAKAKGEVHA